MPASNVAANKVQRERKEAKMAQVYELADRGKGTKYIADYLMIGESTVRRYLRMREDGQESE